MGAGRRTHTRSSGLGFAFADSVDFVESGAWDRLTEGSSIFLSRAYLRTMEASAPDNLRMRYALIYRGREPVAAAAAQVAHLTAERLVPVAETPIAKEDRQHERPPAAVAPSVTPR